MIMLIAQRVYETNEKKVLITGLQARLEATCLVALKCTFNVTHTTHMCIYWICEEKVDVRI